MKDYAIVIVDMLYDFIDGSMACLNAEEAVENTREFIQKQTYSDFNPDDVGIYGDVPILFICDNHPKNHSSFKENNGIWPTHCVKGTRGAKIHNKLTKYINEDLVFLKGENPETEQYSGFEGINQAEQSLGDILEIMDIRNVYVCGIATEYCVRNTCEDLHKAGFNVFVPENCLAYTDSKGHKDAIEIMKKEGIKIIHPKFHSTDNTNNPDIRH